MSNYGKMIMNQERFRKETVAVHFKEPGIHWKLRKNHKKSHSIQRVSISFICGLFKYDDKNSE
jgi:hypothetical protein